MAENEVNVISHLLEVESQATALIDDAQIESNKRITEAKTKADELFYTKYRDIVEAAHNAEIESYKNKISNSEKDVDAFNSFLNKTLFKA